jgi:hypothetical protein
MAAVTPDTITQTNLGSMTTYIYELPATTDSTNTIATGISDIRWVFCSQADAAGTQASQGSGVSWVQSTGVITVYVGEDNSEMTLMVLAGGA